MGTLPVVDAATGEYVFELRNDTNIVTCVVTETDLLNAEWNTNETISIAGHDGTMERHVSNVGTADTNLYIKLLLALQTFLPANDTGYTVQAAGETSHLSLAGNAHGSSGNYTGDERIAVKLFTSAAGMDADTVINDISILNTTLFNLSSWVTRSADDVYTTTAEDVGKTIYLGLKLENPTTPNVWPRWDVITMEVNK